MQTYICAGELAEWSIAAVLKTVDCNRSGGSNPSLSAKSRFISGFFVPTHSSFPLLFDKLLNSL
ncbi:MAG: hypothetical protein RLZZ316_1461 [Bacteroidota bacterium]